MISYLKEIVDTAGLPISEIGGVATFTVVGGLAMVVNNYVKILTYTKEKVVLKLKNDELVVEGTDICIKQLDKSDICLSGNIVRVYYSGALRRYEKME